jgi:hypothetical protein
VKREGKFRVVLFEIISGEHGDEEGTREVQVAEATGGPNVVAHAMEGFAIDMGAPGRVEIEHKEPRRKSKVRKAKDEPAGTDDAEMRKIMADPDARAALDSMLGAGAMDGIGRLMKLHDAIVAQPGKADQS